jgi:hypothetical protein
MSGEDEGVDAVQDTVRARRRALLLEAFRTWGRRPPCDPRLCRHRGRLDDTCIPSIGRCRSCGQVIGRRP